MTRTIEMNKIIEERHKLCKTLYLIKKETDKINKEKRKQGADWKNLTYMNILGKPCHIKILFGPFMKTPLYTEIAILRGHTAHVSCLTLHENKLYSASWNKTIRIWDTETHEEIATLDAISFVHTHNVTCLTLHENKLYSGSFDKTIRIWRV